MIKLRLGILLFIFLMSTLSVVGQTQKQLETQRAQLIEKIKTANKLISEVKKDKKGVLEALDDIHQKIQIREKLIKTITLEIALLSKNIDVNQRKITQLENQLNTLKQEYANLILKSYKSRSQQSRLMFLLSSNSFRQAYKRLQYLKQYTTYRKKQGQKIVDKTAQIKQFVDTLTQNKKAKEALKVSEAAEKKKIEQDKETQESLVSTIKKKEAKYKKQLQKTILEEKRVAKQIDKLIKEAIARANKKARKTLPKKETRTTKNEFILSPEAKALAAKFELNRGKLPWPLKECMVSRRFGKQPHPTIGGITLNSPGLHLLTKKGAYAKAIFDGTVLAIQLTPEGHKNVLIQHGNYISAYNNLENSFVKTGDKVAVGQDLGLVYTDKVTGKTKLIFVLFKNTTRLNPALWMLKR